MNDDTAVYKQDLREKFQTDQLATCNSISKIQLNVGTIKNHKKYIFLAFIITLFDCARFTQKWILEIVGTIISVSSLHAVLHTTSKKKRKFNIIFVNG